MSAVAEVTFPAAEIIARTDDMGRPEWLAARRHGIGGSDAAAVAGLDRWKGGALAVYLDKVEGLEDEVGEAAQWGNLLEPIVADEFSRRSGIETSPAPYLLASVDRPYQLANLDRLAHERGDTGVYEGKVTTVYLADEWDGDQVPDRAMVQTLHYLSVTGFDFAYLACLIGGQRLEWRRVARDDEAIGHLNSIEAEFWQRVEDRRPPPADGSEATGDLLARLYDVEVDKIAVLPPEALDLIGERAAAKAQAKAAEARARLAENRLKQMLADCELGVLDGDVICTWREIPEATVDAYVRKPYRRFNVPKGALR